MRLLEAVAKAHEISSAVGEPRNSCCGVKTVLLLSTRNLLIVGSECGVARLEQNAQKECKRSGFIWDIFSEY